MEKDLIIYCSGNSFIERQLFKFRLGSMIKKCEYLKKSIYSTGELKMQDKKINIIIPDNHVTKTDNVYLMVKGYNKDGSLKPLYRYMLIDNKKVKKISGIENKITVLDLYESCIYLYSYDKDEKYITGFIIKETVSKGRNLNLIFTKEKVKISRQNINDIHEFESVDTFIDKYYM